MQPVSSQPFRRYAKLIQLLNALLTPWGVYVNAVMPASHRFADHRGPAPVTGHSGYAIFTFIANY